MGVELDVDRVTRLLLDTVAKEVLPVFGRLRDEDVYEKSGDAGDVVSIVDHAVEAVLGSALCELLPGSVVVGEEGSHADPQHLQRLLGSAPVWVIDPIDGTRAFVNGEPNFGVMLALVQAQQTQAAWIILPVSGDRFVAQRGAGTYHNDQRVRVQPASPDRLPRGVLYVRYMPDELRRSITQRAADQYVPLPHAGSAAIEYTRVITGESDFVMYNRLLPWDHTPGVLLVQEAGGSVVQHDARPFSVEDRDGPLVVAVDLETSERARSWCA